MKASLKPKGSFASRCSNIDINSIKNMEDLYKYLENNPYSDVLINTNLMHPLYIAKTTLDLDKLKVPHMWAFTRAIRIKSGWVKLKYIAPLYKYIDSHKNIAFILDYSNVMDISSITNCCFPDFLAPAYARTCDKAFERINTLKKIAIPSGDLAIGIGTSFSNSKLVQQVKMKINGIEITIKE